MTPIQKEIKDIDTQIEILKSVREVSDHADSAIRVLYSLKESVKNILPYERECIEKAYNQGEMDCSASEFGGQGEYKNEYDYFTKTYGHDTNSTGNINGQPD